jgi:putative transcriptional regulator
MFFIHSLTYLPESVLLKDGICWQGDYAALLEAIDENAFRPDNGRLLVGYTGWGEGQLVAELEAEDWMVYNGPIDQILTEEPGTMWKNLLQNMGPYYRMVSNFPTDPNLN